MKRRRMGIGSKFRLIIATVCVICSWLGSGFLFMQSTERQIGKKVTTMGGWWLLMSFRRTLHPIKQMELYLKRLDVHGYSKSASWS